MIKNKFPSLLSFSNAFIGIYIIALTIVNQTLSNELIGKISWLFIIAVILDGLDGFIAKKFQSSSDIGIQIDSFADITTFGLAPSFVVFKYLVTETRLDFGIWIILAFIYFSATLIRLSIYNEAILQEGKSKNFSGLPSPAGTIALVSLFFFYLSNPQQLAFFKISLPFLTLFISLLMISKISFPHVGKILFYNYNFKKFCILASYVILLILYPSLIVFLSILGYLLFGMLFMNEKKRKQ